MKLAELKVSLDEEVSTIMAPEFEISVTTTKSVPHSNDGAITFPNLDDHWQGCKLIDTCVLYVDIRRSTELNFSHKPQTVAKLYSAFVRAMTKCAEQYDGHVRGIIGDRIMVIFDTDDCFKNAMDCAILINSAARYVINKHFKHNDVTCGIGIDSGKMLATKTGFHKRGEDKHNYKNLVWLGRPANIASKLTDLANKPAHKVQCDSMEVAYSNSIGVWTWVKEWTWDFVKNLSAEPFGVIRHKNPAYASFITTMRDAVITEETPSILITEDVYRGWKATNPTKENLDVFKIINAKVPGYNGKVYGGGLVYTIFTASQ